MSDNSQNVTITGEWQVTNVGGDPFTHYAPVTNYSVSVTYGPVIKHNAHITNHNAPPTHHSLPDSSTLKQLGHSLAPLDVQSKLQKWTPKNRLFRAKQRKSRVLGVLEEFDDVITKKLGFEFLEGLATDMTNPDPLKRFTMDEVVSRYRETQQGLFSWKLRQRVVRSDEFFLTTIFRSKRHLGRTPVYIVKRIPSASQTTMIVICWLFGRLFQLRLPN